MTDWPVHGRISGPIVMIGFGSIGKGALPLIERHFEFDKSALVVIDPTMWTARSLEERGIQIHQSAVTRENYRDLLDSAAHRGGGQGFCVNLSVDTSSLAIMELCREIGALYIDTVIEPWLGFYFDKNARTGRALQLRAARNRARRRARKTRAARPRSPPAAPIPAWCRGSSSRRWSISPPTSTTRRPSPRRATNGAALAQQLGVKGIHIAERDTQRAKNPKPRGRFVNTWSVEGFVSEGMQPAELGWGTHEKWMPDNGRSHKIGCGAAIYLLQPGANTRVRCWTPTPRPAIRFSGHP